MVRKQVNCQSETLRVTTMMAWKIIQDTLVHPFLLRWCGGKSRGLTPYGLKYFFDPPIRRSLPDKFLATGEPTAEREKWVLSLKTTDTSGQTLPNNVTERRVIPIYKFNRESGDVAPMVQEKSNLYLRDLLLFELDQEPGVPLYDVQEVSNYVAAIDHGLRLLEEGLPLSLRLFREIHGVLLTKGRVSNQTPGEFRRSSSWTCRTRIATRSAASAGRQHLHCRSTGR